MVDLVIQHVQNYDLRYLFIPLRKMFVSLHITSYIIIIFFQDLVFIALIF